MPHPGNTAAFNHDFDPAPLFRKWGMNPRFDQKYADAVKAHHKAIESFNRSPQYDHLSDDKFGAKLNEFAREDRIKKGIS